MSSIIVEKVSLKNAPVSVKKAASVLALVQGDNLLLAIDKLRLVNKKTAKIVYKLLQSAVANIQNNKKMDPSKMKVLRIWATKAPQLRRYRFGARGRVKPYTKYRSNIFAEIGYGA